MFGYIRPYKPELKIKDFSVYKAVYCSLCHSLGKRYGFLSRMILSYDATLMCIIGMSQTDSCYGFEKRRCPVKPYKKCDVARQNAVIDFWADVSVILGYYKVKDNLHDGGLGKKAASLFVLPFASTFYKKAAKRNAFAAQCADEYIKAQTAVEKKDDASIDEASHPTARLMSQLLAYGAQEKAQSRVLNRMGYFLGRWVYLADAADDFDQDIASGGYNPFIAASQKIPATQENMIAALASPLLNSCICEITSAYELLEKRCYGDIIGNIFYLGMPEVKKAILSGIDKKERKKHFGAIYGI